MRQVRGKTLLLASMIEDEDTNAFAWRDRATHQPLPQVTRAREGARQDERWTENVSNLPPILPLPHGPHTAMEISIAHPRICAILSQA